jgi:Cytosol aminopeptidase family, catalytic domain
MSPTSEHRRRAPVEPGAITAALFLAEFVHDVPWAHIDIAGTAWANSSQAWRPKGATGFGARLLIETARNFVAPVSARSPSSPGRPVKMRGSKRQT